MLVCKFKRLYSEQQINQSKTSASAQDFGYQMRYNNNMKKQIFATALLAMMMPIAMLGQQVEATIHVTEGHQKIYKEIYGQFAEHLGTCIYGGLWVGPDSRIANTDGYRNDVLHALQALRIPVLRWPGGCFADDYHWRDGIGPRDKRPTLQNSTWGDIKEDNSFGTHEFLNLCELLGCEPYISGNVGSGTVEELSKWIEYMTSDANTSMANLRRQNGREKPWHVKYLGVGNESWGCGGNMRPEYYSDLYRRYANFCHNYSGNQLFKIASGASDYDFNWTKVLMDRINDSMNGLSLHYYTVRDWGHKGSATHFTADEYYATLGKCLEIEDVIKKHCALIDEKDPQRHIGLMVDEWGTWWDEEPGAIPNHLYQQNSMRDAMVAALTLNVFHRHTDRVRMANIAQVVNVLQSMILTDTIGEGHMVLTPTYHVFRLYKPFQEATYLPVDLKCDTMKVAGERGYDRNLPLVSVSAAKTTEGDYVVSLVNVSLDKKQTVRLNLDGLQAKSVSGEILTAGKIDDYNDYEHTTRVQPAAFRDAKLRKGNLEVSLPAMSIVVLRLK